MLLKTYLIKENTEVLKELFEKYNISLEQIILKEYKRLKLTQDEAWVLISLFNISKDDKNFQIRELANSLDYDQNKLSLILNSLYEKKFYELSLITKNNKNYEVVNLDLAYHKIEELINSDILDKKIKNSKALIEYTILNLERIFKKPLTNLEFNRLKELISNDLITESLVKNALLKLEELNNPNFNYFEKVLNSKPIPINEVKIAPNKVAEVMKLFDKIKK